jgi:hypothetical protein
VATPADDPARERRPRAGVRDVIAGAVLLAIGVVTGATSLDGGADGIDYVFDALGTFWIVWGIYRLVSHKRVARYESPLVHEPMAEKGAKRDSSSS